LFKTLKTFGVFVDSSEVFLEHHVLCRGGTEHLTAPPEVSRAPGGPARRADIVPQQASFAPQLRGLEIADGICTRPAQVTHRFLLHLGHRDRGEVPRAHQAGQFDSIPAVGFAPISGLFGDQRGRDDPANMAFVCPRAREPIPARAGFIDTDAMRTCGRQLTDELIDITLAGTNVAQGDNLGVVCFGDIGTGERLFVDIQTDGEWARLVHG
jgi:hypothetical protein